MKGDLSSNKFCSCPTQWTAADQIWYPLLTKYNSLNAFKQVTRINEISHSTWCSHTSLAREFYMAKLVLLSLYSAREVLFINRRQGLLCRKDRPQTLAVQMPLCQCSAVLGASHI